MEHLRQVLFSQVEVLYVMIQDLYFRQLCFCCQFFELIQIQNQVQDLSVDPLDQDDLDQMVVDDLVQILSLVLLRHYRDLLFRLVVQLFVIVHLVGLKPIMRHVLHRHLVSREQLPLGREPVDAEDHQKGQLVVLEDRVELVLVEARAVHPLEVLVVHPLVDVVHHPSEVLVDLIHLVAWVVLVRLVEQVVLVPLVG